MLYALMSRLENWFDHMYCVSPCGSLRERVFGWLYCHTNPVRPKSKDRSQRPSVWSIAYHVLRTLIHYVRGERPRAVMFFLMSDDHHSVIVEGTGKDLAHSLVIAAEDNPDLTRILEHAMTDLRLIEHADGSGHVKDPLAALLGDDFPSFLMSALSDDEESEADD